MKLKKAIWLVVLMIVVGFGIYTVSLGIKSSNRAEGLDDNAINKTATKVPKDTTKLVISSDYFITQINDIYYNMDDYDGRAVEIEGFPLSADQYKFVGRYGPGCCTGDGYAYIEYTSDEYMQLTDEQDWIKVVGTLKKANDGKVDYMYIDATSVEKLDVRGQDTVTT